ncbi:type II secretion system GspH family protein [Vibrio sp. S4M6]|uniref:type II secretion system protein n=1 Tax=Vibrio sinus TaxID=2946865 RepID=UPI00202A6A4F|nr:type II secretion system protein [Vibrio sinus]MCL9781419.1 type II secretion system GspH family protein [Vibrio sinus]
MKWNKAKSKGFTLIELTVGVVLIGVLSVVAAPKMFSVSSEAKTSTVQKVARNFKSSIDLIKSAWHVEGGQGSTVQVQGQTISINSSEWPGPAGAPSSAPSDNDCLELWNQVLKTEETIATSTGSENWLASGFYNASQSANFCSYQYLPNDSDYRGFVYNLNTGDVNYTDTNPNTGGGGGGGGSLGLFGLIALLGLACIRRIGLRPIRTSNR